MKLITMTRAAMLALAPAAGFAQQTSYPDLGAIAKTSPVPEKAAPEERAPPAGVVEPAASQPSAAKQDAPQMRAADKTSAEEEASYPYPDWGSIAKSPQ